MKRFISLVLAVLMLLPAFALISFADGVSPASTTGTHEGENVAGDATLKYYSKQTEESDPMYVNIETTTKTTDYSKVIDGDTTTGTKTGRSAYYAFELVFDEILYFTDVVLFVNGDGTLPDGSTASNNNSIDKLTVNMYKTGELVKSVQVEASGKEEVSISVESALDTIEIYRDQSSLGTSDRGKDFIREIEAYSAEREFCNVIKSNIASEALVYAAGTNDGDYCDAWWAWEPKALVDGNLDVGTRSPKGWNYSVFLDFTKDYMISELVLTLGGKGELLNSGFVEEVKMNISQIRVKLYNLEGDMVYDSKPVSVDTATVKLDPFVEACRVKVEIANGKGEGSEFMWEIETYVEEGSHVFEQTGEKNPTCNRPGYIEQTCHCGKVVKRNVPETGFHTYDEGVITTPATAYENGILTKTCVDCLATADFDIPATAHNWDNGTEVAPDCDTEGSTTYKCTGCDISATCDTSYVTDIVPALGHDWDDGVVTVKATVKTYGQKKLTCLRDGCGVIEYKQTRKLQYTDSTTEFDFSKVDYDIVVDYNEESELYNPAKDANYKLITDEKEFDNIVDGDMLSYWYGPTGSTYTIIFDQEYIFTKGTLFASGNNTTLQVEWFDANNERTAIYATKWNTIGNGTDKTNPINVNMSESLTGGARAKKIVITLTGAKWENGWAMSLHELDFVVHDCQVDESDYILSGSSYKAPSCGVDGSCLAKCPVCSNQIPVVLPGSTGHNVTNVTTDVAPTCSDAGYGHGNCTKCGETIQNVVIPSEGKHKYDKNIVYMEATCGSKGIAQTVCSGCGRVGSQAPIEATGIHTPKWVEDYCTTYTHEGKLVYKCSDCGLMHEENGVSEKVIDKKVVSSEFVTLVETKDNGNGSATITFKIDLDELSDVEYECDVRIITYIEDSNGNVRTVESYGKYSHNMRETDALGQVSSTIENTNGCKIYSIVRLMNFRGITLVDISE